MFVFRLILKIYEIRRDKIWQKQYQECPSTRIYTADKLKNHAAKYIDIFNKNRKQVITEEDVKNSYTPEEFKAVMKEDVKQIFNQSLFILIALECFQFHP